MKLILNPEFEKPQSLKGVADEFLGAYAKGINPALYSGVQPLKSGCVKEVDHSSYVIPSMPPAVELAKAVCGVQSMTSHNHPLSKPSLQNTYLKGKWPDHAPGQSVTRADLYRMFDALVLAMRKYVVEEQGLSVSQLQLHKPMAIVEIRATIDIIIPTLSVNAAAGFSKTVLAEAVFLKVCGEHCWTVMWDKFIDAIKGVYYEGDKVAEVEAEPANQPVPCGSIPSTPIVDGEFVKKLTKASQNIFDNTKKGPNYIGYKCDEENNPPEDVEQGKVNVDVVVPAHVVEHVELDFVVMPNGKKVEVEVGSNNQPVPCGPPSLVVEADKVPVVDKNGKKIASPSPGWWVGNDMCWHPPIKNKWSLNAKQQEADILGLVTALNPLSVVVEDLKKTAMQKGCDLSEGQVGKLAQDLVVYGTGMVNKETGEVVDPKMVGIFPSVLGPLPSPAEVKYVHTSYMPLYTTPVITLEDFKKKKLGVSIGGHGTIGPGGEVEDFKFDGAWPITITNSIAKSAPCAPTLIDDAAAGFKVGDVWYNSSNGILHRCMDCSIGVAMWLMIGEVTPTPEGPKVIALGNPKHLVDLNNEIIEGMKVQQQLSDPIGVTYVDTSDQPDLQASFSPEAEKDLVQAMVKNVNEEIQKEIEEKVVDGPDTVDVVVTELGQPNKNGNVYGESYIHKMIPVHKAMSDAAYMQAKLNQALGIPPHLLHGPVQNTK